MPQNSRHHLHKTPAYLPVSYDGAGEYALTLPGGKAFWVELTDERMLALVLVWLAGAAALGFVLGGGPGD